MTKDTITIEWSIEDVHMNEDDRDNAPLTDDQAREVLRLADNEHDACVGINWDVLGQWADYVRKKGE